MILEIKSNLIFVLPGKDEGPVLRGSIRVAPRIFRPALGLVCLEEDCTCKQNSLLLTMYQRLDFEQVVLTIYTNWKISRPFLIPRNINILKGKKTKNTFASSPLLRPLLPSSFSFSSSCCHRRRRRNGDHRNTWRTPKKDFNAIRKIIQISSFRICIWKDIIIFV